MTNKRFANLMQEIFDACLVLSKAKGEDYTKGSADALANFKEGGKALAIDPQKVCWIFLNKHYQAITNYIKTEGKSESEPVAERIKDLINYLVLLAALIEEANGTGPKEAPEKLREARKSKVPTDLDLIPNLHTQPDAPESSPLPPEYNGCFLPKKVSPYQERLAKAEQPVEQRGAGDDYPVCPV